MSEIIVQKGQTLSQIAKANNTTVAALAKANGIKDVNNIKVGQKLSLGEVSEPSSKSKAQELGDLDERIAANQKEIEKLKNRTLTQQAAEEIGAEITKMEQKLKGLGKEAKEAMQKEIDAAKQKLTAAYQKGVDAYNKAKQEVKNDFNAAMAAVRQAYDNTVDSAESTARSVAAKGKSAAKSLRDAAKAEVKDKPAEKTPDFSKMTREEILAYQQSEIQKLKNEKLSDKATKEIQNGIDSAERYLKQKYNNAVDKAYNTAAGVYHTVADATKKVFGWFRR